MKLSNYVAAEAVRFAHRADAIFGRYEFKWAGKTVGDPDYRPNKTEILNRVHHLVDCCIEAFDEFPDCKISTQSMGRITVIAHRSEDTNWLYDVSFSLDII